MTTDSSLTAAIIFVAAPLLILIMIAVAFPKIWLSPFVLVEAYRVKFAGMTDMAIKSSEMALAKLCFSLFQVISLSDAGRAWTYLCLSGDSVSRRRSGWLGVLIAVLVLLDGSALGYALAPVAGVNVSEDMQFYLACAAGVLVAGLLALSMHAAGCHLKWYGNTRDLCGRIISDGGTVPAANVLLSQVQDIDAGRPPAERQWARAERTATLVPVYLCIAFVLFITIAVAELRHQELLQLRAAGATDLPGDDAFMLGIGVLAVLFAALQFSIFWMAYRRAWLGRESGRAFQLILNGRVSTERSVIQHNSRALDFADRIHHRFHQHLQRLNRNGGYRGIHPIVFPAQVLAEMLSERDHLTLKIAT